MIAPLIDLLKEAPSAGNLQPWVLWIEETLSHVNIRIHLDENHQFSEKATDHCGSGALISLGILSYSIEYLCADFGYHVEEKSFTSNNNIYQNQIVLRLKPVPVQRSKRPEMYKVRFTDRRNYETLPISPDVKLPLMREFKDYLSMYNSEDDLKTLTEIFKSLSLIRFMNPVLFAELSLELKADLSTPTGIPIDNLGLSVFLSRFLKLQKHFPIQLPISSAYIWPLYESITKPFKNSAEIWCLKMPGKESLDWMQLGEKLMKIWLDLTEAGIRLHPFGNTLTIYNYYQDPTFFNFTPSQIQTIDNTHKELITKLGVDSMHACMFFRIGYSNLPKQSTSRKDIETHSI